MNKLTIVIFVLLFAFSCTKDDELEKTNSRVNESFVELPQIKNIASNIFFPVKTKGTNNKGNRANTKTIDSIKEIKNQNDKTSFYIINYNEGGFVILSADRRTQPVLGFSISNKFIIDENSYPAGLEFWINDVKEQIFNIQKSNIKQSNNEELAWRLVQQAIINEINSSKNVPIEDCY